MTCFFRMIIIDYALISQNSIPVHFVHVFWDLNISPLFTSNISWEKLSESLRVRKEKVIEVSIHGMTSSSSSSDNS